MNGLLIVWQSREAFLWRVANTLSLVLSCLLLSIPLGILGAIALRESRAPLRRTLEEFIDLLRCVPFLLLAYVVYYGLPEIGLRLDPWWAGLASLTVYNTAYLVEISGRHFSPSPETTSRQPRPSASRSACFTGASSCRRSRSPPRP